MRKILTFFLIINFYLWLHWVFAAAHGLSLLAESRGRGGGGWLLSSCSPQASHCHGFSCCRAQALGPRASVVIAHGISCSEVLGIFPNQRWIYVPGLNLNTRGFLSTVPLEKSFSKTFFFLSSEIFNDVGRWSDMMLKVYTMRLHLMQFQFCKIRNMQIFTPEKVRNIPKC